MKLIVDGVIETLQNGGGCTVYFDEILSFYQKENKPLQFIRYKDAHHNIGLDGKETTVEMRVARFQERWRDVPTDSLSRDSVFHSTHYRLPVNKNAHCVITTVHDFTYELFRKGAAQWMHSWQKNRAIKGSDGVICVSNNTAEDLLRYCPIDESKIQVIHNGVSSVYRQLEDIAKTNEVVFVGARGWYKNFGLAVDALAKRNDLTLSIVGGGALTAEEVQMLDAKLPERYKHMGRVTDEELNHLYNRAHCLLYPSSYEGFGIPVIEAMSAGCAVIAVNKSSIPEVAGNAGLLIPEASVDYIVSALQDLDNSVRMSRAIQDGLLQAKKFSWEKCYNETYNFYKKSN
ncbi:MULTISPECIES: glycosyltransferase family 4 protein [Enterobacteriaceae]|uniref:glycosyltransferase family 4 protein n=1 Tax=Enterobacteriaceae TaxID=543 RepID=UPI000DA1773B|nr:glycosyltransferase family 1 protein [Cronobacter sakazakii]